MGMPLRNGPESLSHRTLKHRPLGIGRQNAQTGGHFSGNRKQGHVRIQGSHVVLRVRFRKDEGVPGLSYFNRGC